MNIMSKAISSLLLLILIFYETRSKQNVLFKSLIIPKLKLFFYQLLSTYFFTRVSLDADCRLLIAFIFYPNILVFLVLHLRSLNFLLQFPQVFKGVACQFQEFTPWHSFHSIFMHIIKALVGCMFTLRRHFQHQEISSFF